MKTNHADPMHPAAVRVALSEGAFDLSFIKENGDIRHMVCTTRPDLISQVTGRDGNPHYDYIQKIDVETDLVRAFDLQKGEWRSFYAATVFRFEEFDDVWPEHTSDPLYTGDEE